MSTKAISDSQATMYLGVVKINNQRYAAILHFKTDEGENRLITQNMLATREVAQRLFQEVITPYNESQVVTKVNGWGFHHATDSIMPHDALQTGIAWQTFIRHLDTPHAIEEEEEQVDVKGRTEVELVDLTPLDDIKDDKAFAQALYRKIKAARDIAFPILTLKERLFLQHRVTYSYPKLLAGEFDAKELNNLLIEAGISQD